MSEASTLAYPGLLPVRGRVSREEAEGWLGSRLAGVWRAANLGIRPVDRPKPVRGSLRLCRWSCPRVAWLEPRSGRCQVPLSRERLSVPVAKEPCWEWAPPDCACWAVLMGMVGR